MSTIIVLSLILTTVAAASISQLLWKMGLKGRLKKFSLKKLIKALFTPLVFTGMVLYGVSALLWLIVLSQSELNWAYPFMAISYPAVTALSYIMLKEKIKRLRIIGVAVIIIGVVMVGLSRVS